MAGTVVRERVAALRAALDAVADCDVDALTAPEVLSVMDDMEAVFCQMPTQLQRMLAHLQAETTPKALGAKSWHAVLRIRWRLSTAEAGRRLAEAADLGPRRALTGEPLAPVLAAAQAAGTITGEHVTVLRDTMRSLPAWVDAITREQIELDLVRVALGVGPKELRETAALRVFLLDQDGPEPDDAERARKRGVSTGKQGRDAMSSLTGNLSPEAAAVWEVLFAKFAAPACATPTTTNPAPPAPPARRRSTTTTAPSPSVSTTRCSWWGESR